MVSGKTMPEVLSRSTFPRTVSCRSRRLGRESLHYENEQPLQCGSTAGRTKDSGPVKSPKRVAIIDDDQQLLLAISDLLRSYGIEALTFPSAEEFLKARPPTVDCLIVDVHMPGMNGLDMIAKLRNDGDKVPIIVLSAMNQSTEVEALARGADAYFAKPADADALMKCMVRITNPTDPDAA